MNSPFPYDKLPDSTQFFGRSNEILQLSNTVKYSNNLLLYSKRRMGKSSLIKNFFAKNSDEYLCVYVDIFDITTKEDFAHSFSFQIESPFLKPIQFPKSNSICC